jgi:hypothetical protein
VRQAQSSLFPLPTSPNPAYPETPAGSTDAVDWKDQWWSCGLPLLKNWALLVLSQHQNQSHLCMWDEVSSSTSIMQMSQAILANTTSAMNYHTQSRVEVRLVLVSSSLARALVFVPPPADAQAGLSTASLHASLVSGSLSGVSEGLMHSSVSSVQEEGAGGDEGEEWAAGPQEVRGPERGAAAGAGAGGSERPAAPAGSSERAEAESSSRPPGRAAGSAPAPSGGSARARGRPGPTGPHGGGGNSGCPASPSAAGSTPPGRHLPSRLDSPTPPIDRTSEAPEPGAPGSAPQPAEPSPRSRSVARVDPSARPSAGQDRSSHTSATPPASGPQAAMPVPGGAQMRWRKPGTRRGSTSLLKIGDHSVTLSLMSMQESQPAAPQSTGPQCIPILTDSTLLMNALEAGDVMTINDCSSYQGSKRVLPHDVALEDGRQPQGTLFLLPLAHKGRPMGGLYVFSRYLAHLSKGYWSMLAGEPHAMHALLSNAHALRLSRCSHF